MDILTEETTVTENCPIPSLATPAREKRLLVQMAGAAGARAEGGPPAGAGLCGAGSPHTPASYPAGPVTVSTLQLLCLLGNDFFLSHRDRNLASRHGKCQGSCLGPSFRLSAKKGGKQSTKAGGREPRGRQGCK